MFNYKKQRVMICTFYTHKIGFEALIEVLKKNIPKGKITLGEENGLKIIRVEIKGGLFSTSSVLKISYRERLTPDYQISEREDCPLNQNLKGLFGFVSSLPTSNEKIKGLFLQKTQTFNSEFSILQETGKTKNIKEILHKVAIEFEAVLFVQPETVISKVNEQHFLDENLNLIIDQQGNCEIESLTINIDAKYFDGDQKNIQEDQKIRKEKSEVVLNEHAIKINKNLPFIESEEEVVLRTPKEMATRVTILAYTNLVAFNNITGEKAIEEIKKYNLWDVVTPDEKSFLENPTEERKNHETWKCESIWTLMWSLKVVDTLGFPKDLADLKNIPFETYPIGENKDPNVFINQQENSRSKKEILDANDLYYRMSWASVDARINGIELTEIHAGVVYERHYVLNWLVNYREQGWDDVSCDT